ncbi:uncharacterized protein LOC144354982 [Saccoglossus kowalevskii]
MGIGDVDPVITLEDTPVEAVDSFKYLGSYVTMTNKLDTEIQVRKGRASVAFAKLKQRRGLPPSRKNSSWMPLTISVSEGSWEYDDSIEYEIQPSGQPPVSLWLRQRRLRLFGHVCRIGPEKLPRALMDWNPEDVGSRWKRGRNPTRWKEAVERDARSAGVTGDICPLAADQQEWGNVVALVAM